MRIFNSNKIIRFLILSWNYKISYFSYLLRCICYLPFFSYEVNRIEDKIKDGVKSKGHIQKGKKIIVKLFNFNIIKFTLKKSEALTAEHFYFQRSVKDIRFLLENSKNFVNIHKDTIIIDPGCGTGKHLLYITDEYGCKGVGIDVYPNAINIPKKIEKFSNCKFLLGNSCDKNTLSLLLKYNNPKKNVILYMNSWVKHVYNNQEFGIFLDFIKKIRCTAMIIESKKIDLRTIFKTNKVLYHKIKDKIQYTILEI